MLILKKLLLLLLFFLVIPSKGMDWKEDCASRCSTLTLLTAGKWRNNKLGGNLKGSLSGWGLVWSMCLSRTTQLSQPCYFGKVPGPVSTARLTELAHGDGTTEISPVPWCLDHNPFFKRSLVLYSTPFPSGLQRQMLPQPANQGSFFGLENRPALQTGSDVKWVIC